MTVFVRAPALASVATAFCVTAPASVPTSHNSASTTAKMRFKLASKGGVSCCEWIAAKGEITKQTPNDFKAFLNEWKTWGGLNGHTIRFNSPGGDLIAGVQLGELFRSGWTARVRRRPLLACLPNTSRKWTLTQKSSCSPPSHPPPPS